MNILRRLQLVAHGEPSDVIELSSLEPAATNRKRTGRRIVSSICQATNHLSLMWIIKSAQEPVYTVFKNPTMKGMTMKPEKNLSVVRGESRGILAAIAKLMRRRSVIDIVERFQTKHALQEEQETKNFHPSTNGAVAPGIIR